MMLARKLLTFYEPKYTSSTDKKRKATEFMNQQVQNVSIKARRGKYDEFELDTFKNVKQVELIMGDSNNAFVYKLMYEIPSFPNMRAILKSTLTPTSDHLVYEYVAGLCINQYMDRFPCFVQTYGMFKYENLTKKEELKNAIEALEGRESSFTEVDMLRNSFNKIDSCKDETSKNLGETSEGWWREREGLAAEIYNMCKKDDAVLYSVLSQSVADGSPSFHDFVNDLSPDSKMDKYKICSAFLNVYAPLYFLRSEFTHYDLHDSNVLMSPYGTENKYIKFVYHYEAKVKTYPYRSRIEKKVDIYSHYVPKIIDYGRCYCKDAVGFIRREIETQVGCDDDTGFAWSTGNCETERGYVCSDRPNASSDLWLLYSLRTIKRWSNLQFLETTFEKYIFDERTFKRVLVDDIPHGVQESRVPEDNTLAGRGERITNIEDAFFAFVDLCEAWEQELRDEGKWAEIEQNIAHTVHIYQQDKKMKFENNKVSKSSMLGASARQAGAAILAELRAGLYNDSMM